MLIRYVVNEQLAQAILDYLATRPYCEVFKLVQALQASPQIHGTGLECDKEKPAEKPAKKEKAMLLEQ